jgi:hypothetical protein
VTVTPNDLGTYLGTTLAYDDERALLMISLAVGLCESIVNPLPPAADAVILDVAARAYSNPGNVTAQGAAPFSVNYGAVSGGLWLTRQNKATLRRLNGSGGAFTIDTAPAIAQALPWWETNAWDFGEGMTGSDWDSP